MNKFLKVIIVIMALICLVSSVVACDNVTEGSKDEESTKESTTSSSSNETNQTQTEASESVTEVVTESAPEVEKNNYNETFYLKIQAGGTNPKKFYWVEEGSNDAMSEAIYARQMRVQDYLGVEVMGVEAGTYDQYAEAFKIAVKNKDGSVHTLQTHVYMGLVSFITESYVIDYKDMPGINLNADYWNRDFMEGLAAGDHLYLGYCDYNLVNTNVITFNKRLMDQYDDALNESVYSMVENYRWTLDSMISLANLVYVDKTADGKTADDTFGITGNQWVPFCGFLQACNINFIDIDESGKYVLGVYNELTMERTTQLIDKLSELSKDDCSWFWYRVEGTEQVPITTGRTLMYMQSTFALTDNLDYDLDFGVLPFPMFDENQKDVGYRSLEWGGLLCIPAYLENEQMVGETLEMMAYYSDEVTVTFYEKLLGKQVADAPEDKKMLDIVWDSVCSDFGLNYSTMSASFDQIVYMVPNLTYVNSEYELASYVKSNQRGCEKALDAFFRKISKLN